MSKNSKTDEIDTITKNFIDNIKIDTIYNDGDKLPFALYEPQNNGKLVWICANDQDGKITSVFAFKEKSNVEKACTYVESLEKAIEMRDELIANNWKPMNFKFSVSMGSYKKEF